MSRLRIALCTLAATVAGGTAVTVCGQTPAPPRSPAAKERALVAAEPTPGRIARRVTFGSKGHSYACFLPRAYDDTRVWPVLYVFSPLGDGPPAVALFHQAAEKYGIVCIASNDSKNGPLQTEAILGMFEDSKKRFRLDTGRILVTGFSGGSRVATWFGRECKAIGHLAMGGVVLSSDEELPGSMAYYLACGETDPNRKEMEWARDRLDERRVPHTFEVYEGGHQPPRIAVLEKALLWFDTRWRASPAARARLREELDDLRSHRKDEPARCYWTAVHLRDRYHEVEGLDAVEPLVTELARTPQVRRELRAMQRFEECRAAEAKLTGARAIQRYRAMEQLYAGTRAADLARRRVQEIESARSAADGVTDERR